MSTADMWLSTWDRQQAAYIPGREARIDFLTAVTIAVGGTRPRILDLGCGPGSLLRRLRHACPDAVLVGVDFDPVLLDIAATVVPPDEHTRLVDADLRRPGWVPAASGFGPYDVVLACTALHWLAPAEIARTYASACTLLRPGGMLLNADTMPMTGSQATADLLDTALGTASDPTHWTRWWEDLGAAPTFAAQFAERQRRQRVHPRTDEFVAGADWHQNTMRANGFDEAAVIWRIGNEAVVAGRRQPLPSTERRP